MIGKTLQDSDVSTMQFCSDKILIWFPLFNQADDTKIII